QIWPGAFGDTSPPSVTWKIDGKGATPAEPGNLAPAHSQDARCWTGTAVLPNLDKGTYTINATAPHYSSGELKVRTIPDEVPKDDWLRILLASCYYHPTDRGRLASFVNRIPAASRPHLTILMGDQVYL